MDMHWLKRVDSWLAALSRPVVLILALLLALAVGVADFFVDPDLLILYLAPLFMAAWYDGSRSGYVVSIYAASASFLIQSVLGQSPDLDTSAISTMTVRLLAFLTISHVFSRLRESRRQQDELVEFIIHDLRSPISSAITGLMTLEQSETKMDMEEKEMVQLALVSNQRALTLVNSILDVAKLESGKMEVRWEELEVERFLQDCLSPLALWAQGHNVRFEVKALKERAVIDRDLTARVLANLLGNALKFSPEGSAIVVEAAPDHQGVKFSVVDEGPGIPAEYVEKIFEPFGQVKGTQGGTGLGLTFCRLAVQAQGGKIGVKSQLGQGSSFWFTIPDHGANA